MTTPAPSPAPALSEAEARIVAAFETAVTPPEVREAAVLEEVARAIRRAWLLSFDNRDDWDFAEDDTRIHYRRLAAAAVAAYRATQDGGAGEAVRDLVHHIARMHDRWADMGAEDPDARNRELWAPLHRKADAVRDLIPGEAL